MARPVTLFTGQWADLSLEVMAQKAKEFGYDGIELACWGDHFDVQRALNEEGYCASRWEILSRHGLRCYAISNHLIGQAVCDQIDERHQAILPPHVWGDGSPEGVRQRAAEEMKNTARAARKLFDAAPSGLKPGRVVVNGFTGSSIWYYLYSFPPVPTGWIDQGYQDFAKRWLPILDEFDRQNVDFALEVHPTEIAFDIASAARSIEAVGGHRRFGFNYDPSHLGYQGVDYVQFIRTFRDRIFHMHVKDVWWSPTLKEAGVFGGHLNFGDSRRFWDFRSPGRGSIQFEEIIRALNEIGYHGPLSIEWEDSGMDREHGAKEACAFTRKLDFAPSNIAFDAAFSEG